MKIENGVLHCVYNADINADGSFIVPNNVTRIGSYAFMGCYGLTSIIVPNSVTSIGDSAFYGCSVLKSVTIGNGVTRIGGNAFRGCFSLTSVALGNGVTSIERFAFASCFFHLTSKKANYKAFNLTENGELLCRDKTYAVGEKSVVEGELELCENGIHYCTNIFDIFNYYYGEYGKDFVIGVCEVSDENIGSGGDSKRCARWIIPTKILSREEVIGIMNGEDGGIVV